LGAQVDVKRTIELLNSEDAIVAGKAAGLLGDSKDVRERAILALIEHLGDEREAELNLYGPVAPPTVGDYAAGSLVEIGKSAIVPPLCKFLADSDSETARIRALQTLEKMGKTAHDSLTELKIQAQAENTRIRFHAIEAMISVSTSHNEVLPLLRRALRDEDPHVKYAAVRGLGNLGSKAEGLVPELLPLLESSELRGAGFSSDARGVSPLYDDVVDSLATLTKASPDRAPAIMRAMNTDPNGQVRAGAALVMIRTSLNKPEALTALKRVLEEGREGVDKALEALKDLRDDGREAEPLVLAFVKHDDESIRFRAIDTLGAIGGEAGISALIETMGDDDVVVRSYAAAALGDLGPNARKAVPILSEAVVHPDTPRSFLLRRRAVEALGKIGPAARPALPNLLEVLKNREKPSDIRGAAASALGNIAPRDPEVLATLRAVLHEEPNTYSGKVWVSVAAAFGKAGPAAESVVPLLTGILNDASPRDEVRASAAQSLGQIGVASKEVVSALSQALREEKDVFDSFNESLRRESASALGALRATSALPVLKKISLDSNEYESVRKAAAEAVRPIQVPE